MVVLDGVPVNHQILEWARLKAKLSRDLAAQKAKITPIKRGRDEMMTSSSRLESWEKGNSKPTYHQLVNIAKAYRRPLLTFFLTEPPRQEIKLLDFRSFPNKDNDVSFFEAEFSALVRQTEAIQKSVREILQESEKGTLNFIGSVSLTSNPNEVAHQIRTTLNYDISNQKRLTSVSNLFSYIRNLAAEHGIYVMVQGNLGSTHTNMFPEIFRGFTLCDRIAPFIVVNPNDTKTANVFTLIHEFCHLWLGDTGVSNWNSLNIKDSIPASPKEVFCDRVSAEFLVPEHDLIEHWDTLTIGYEKDIVISRIAQKLKVSPIVIARRLLEFNKITSDYYWDWYDAYQKEWLTIKEKLRHAKKEPLSYRIRARNKLGIALISTVLDATNKGRISEMEASRILNVKINNFPRIS